MDFSQSRQVTHDFFRVSRGTNVGAIVGGELQQGETGTCEAVGLLRGKRVFCSKNWDGCINRVFKNIWGTHNDVPAEVILASGFERK
jgi:hypothetical protein